MAIMNRARFRKQLQEGLNTVFGLEYKRYEQEWRPMFDTENSTKAYEEDVLLAGLAGAPVKPEGAPVAYDQGGEFYRDHVLDQHVEYPAELYVIVIAVEQFGAEPVDPVAYHRHREEQAAEQKPEAPYPVLILEECRIEGRRQPQNEDRAADDQDALLSRQSEVHHVTCAHLDHRYQ